jgi:hypothetical protein
MRREGIDIHSDVEISYVDAILGSQVKVTTVDGPVELKIPAGTQPGTTLLMAKRWVAGAACAAAGARTCAGGRCSWQPCAPPRRWQPPAPARPWRRRPRP